MDRILVTPRSLTRDRHPALDRLADAGYELVFSAPGVMPSPEQTADLLEDCVGYLAGVEPITGRVLERAPRLRVISRNGVGVDAIDMEAAKARGVRVLTAPGANAQGVVELTLGLILCIARRIPHANASLKSGEWVREKGLELAGRALGVVGYGQIGSRVATLGGCLGMRVTFYDPCFTHTSKSSYTRCTSVEELFETCDVISLHAPPSDTPLVTTKLLQRVRAGTILVNTARSELVDDAAVLRALDDGTLLGYAVDAYATEPPTNQRLVKHPRVVATSHLGGYTRESVDRAVNVAVDRLLEELSRTADRKPG